MSLDGSSGMAFEGDGLGHHERRFSPRKTCFTSGVIFKRDTALRLNCVLRDMSATGARMELRTPDGDLYETCTRLPAYFTLRLGARPPKPAIRRFSKGILAGGLTCLGAGWCRRCGPA